MRKEERGRLELGGASVASWSLAGWCGAVVPLPVDSSFHFIAASRIAAASSDGSSLLTDRCHALTHVTTTYFTGFSFDDFEANLENFDVLLFSFSYRFFQASVHARYTVLWAASCGPS